MSLKFLLGVATGAGLVMYFSSPKGKQAINNLKSSASNMVDEAVEKGQSKVKDFANDLFAKTGSSAATSESKSYNL